MKKQEAAFFAVLVLAVTLWVPACKSPHGPATGSASSTAKQSAYPASSSFVTGDLSSSPGINQASKAGSSSNPGQTSDPPSRGIEPDAGIPVLCYHDIMLPKQKGNSNNSLVITTDEFDRQMLILKQAGYSSVSFEQLRHYLLYGGNMQKKFALTFDDGYKTTFALGAPILRKYGYQATIFVIAHYAEEPDAPAELGHFVIQYGNRKDMQQNADVFSYGSHTYNMHINLPTEKNDAKLEADFAHSRRALNNTPYFAYPSGRYDDRVIGLLQKAGFQMAFTTRHRFARKGDTLFIIPRIEIYSPMSDRAFKNVLKISS